MTYFRHLAPILLFIALFVGSGIYFSILEIPNAFYKLSPVSAILPAIALSWILGKGNSTKKMNDFLDGFRHKDIITMCIIFLLAGAFSEVTIAIGCVDATVKFTLNFIPSKFLIIGIFLTAALVSTAIGTSMGTIATIAPFAAELALQTDFSASLLAATVVGGAMFGDNLSLISDTTIAAVASQEADLKKKFKLNALLAAISSLCTILILLSKTSSTTLTQAVDYSSLLITPYLFLLILAISGINVFITLFLSITFAGLIGILTINDFSILGFAELINKGFESVNDIMLLSLLVGGLSGLIGKDYVAKLATSLSNWIIKINAGPRLAQGVIGLIASIFDILLANNTIAIIFSGEIAKEIAIKHNIKPHYSATWLDVFSCVFQGIIPYGAQVLLASSIIGVSPLSIIGEVYYCYILAVTSLLFIYFNKSGKV